MMKKLLCITVFIAGAFQHTASQDLKSAWERIQAEFLGGMHDSVVAHMGPFIEELRERGLSSQLSVAYFHSGVSFAHLDDESSSDTAFFFAKHFAADAGDSSKVHEITAKQVQLYLGLAKQQEAPNPGRAVGFYQKALQTLGPLGESKTRAVVLFQIGTLHRTLGDFSAAVTALESSLAISRGLQGEDRLRASTTSALNELYLKTGRTQKAEVLASQGGSETSRIEYTIKLAAESEQSGDLQRADGLLASVQAGIIAGGDESRILEFAKKRYSIREQLDGPERALDTLHVLLSTVKGSSPAVQFHVTRFVTMLTLQRGNVEEAGHLVARMRALAGSGGLEVLLYQTDGDLSYLQGDNDQAIALYRKALQSNHLFDPGVRFSMMNNMGLALSRNGEYQEALNVFEQLYASASEDATFRIQADLNAGIVLVKSDKPGDAIERFKRARDRAGTMKNAPLRIMASLRLAESYRRSGIESSANALFDEVSEEQVNLVNPFDRIQVLQALAAQAQGAGNIHTALVNLRQAYALATQAGASGYLAPLASDLGDTYFLVDSVASAIQMYDVALSFYGGTQDTRAVVELRYKKGQCFLSQSRFGDARSEVQTALNILGRSTGLPAEKDLLGMGYATLAFIDFTEGKSTGSIRNLLKSLEDIQKASSVLEDRLAAGVGQSQLESNSLRNVNAYRLYVDIAAELFQRTGDIRYFELAFNTSDKSRAEAFVKEVGSRLVTKLNDPSVRDLASAAGQLLEQQGGQTALSVDLTSTAAGTRGIVKKSESKEEAAIQKYDAIVQRLSSEKNKAAQLVTVNTLTLSSVRSLLRDADVMLNYYVSLDNVYLFVVTKNDQMLHTIQWKPEDLAAVVEGYRTAVHDLNRTDYAGVARRLYDSLLAPVAARLEGKELIIVPSGRLNNLPFSGLLNDSTYLVESHSLTVIPNASALQFVQSGKKFPSSPSVLAIGNPINPRVTRLPGTEQEVAAIQKVYPRSLIYLGADATESNSRAHMGGFDIVHLACHGLFNYDYPYLSSLALSPDARNDGFLEVHELYNLNLTKTNLVILSACETGLAKIRKNDDVIGLVRGFLYAGVPSMAASLWKVDDFATAALMTQFHVLLKLGNSKSEALRKAQLQLLRSETTRHPYYWAAFVLYGSAH